MLQYRYSRSVSEVTTDHWNRVGVVRKRQIGFVTTNICFLNLLSLTFLSTSKARYCRCSFNVSILSVQRIHHVHARLSSWSQGTRVFFSERKPNSVTSYRQYKVVLYVVLTVGSALSTTHGAFNNQKSAFSEQKWAEQFKGAALFCARVRQKLCILEGQKDHWSDWRLGVDCIRWDDLHCTQGRCLIVTAAMSCPWVTSL